MLGTDGRVLVHCLDTSSNASAPSCSCEFTSVFDLAFRLGAGLLSVLGPPTCLTEAELIGDDPLLGGIGGFELLLRL